MSRQWWLLNCQLSTPLVSTGRSLQQPDRILDKVPAQVCPRHGLFLAQTLCCCSLWPVNTDRLDTLLHAIAHPIQAKVALSSAVFSLLKCVTTQVGWKSATKSDETISDTSSSCFLISISQSNPPAALQTEVKHKSKNDDSTASKTAFIF